MTWVLLFLFFLIVVGLIGSGRRRKERSGASQVRITQRGSRTSDVEIRVSRPMPQISLRIEISEEPARPEPRMPFAEPGLRGPLFHFGGDGRGETLRAPYAVVDVETTGFSPKSGDRVVEIAVARLDEYGRIEDEYATLLNPGRDTGPVFVHGISTEAVRDAPTFQEIAGEVLARLDGAIVVAHNAVFEERFLAAEFRRIGVRPPVAPALCSLWLAQRTLRTPNHKLATLARWAGLSTVDGHSALGDVRSVAALLPLMLEQHGEPLRYACGLSRMPVLPRGRRPKTRAAELRKGTEGWMASVMARLPMSAAEARDVDAERYLEALAVALEDGKIVGDEAKALAKLAGSAGLGGRQVADLHRRFLDSMRHVAFADDILTPAELRQLRSAAGLLGMPDYFDDLTATPVARAVHTQGSGVPSQRAPRRCGHCRQAGHNRATCPELALV
jgi:DNA polymerase III epsilon subunit-like protein